MGVIARIILEEFTAFKKLNLNLSPGINVLLGKNGVGKTHLLKVIYAACAVTYGEDAEKGFGLKLCNVFNPYEGRPGRLSKRVKGSVRTRVAVFRGGRKALIAKFSNHSKKSGDIQVTGESDWKSEELNCVYIPVKEMLTHAPGFLATVSRREIAFEDIYVDIIKRANLPKLKNLIGESRNDLLKQLEGSIDGKVFLKNEHFFLKNNQGELEFTLLAEGMRKLALIWLLIQNGVLFSGSVLFWDEPEANLNPSLIGDVVEIILTLQRLGVQVFLATHNYVLLKEFDLRQKSGDMIRYISLYRDQPDGDISSSFADAYAGITPDAIAETFDRLYDEEIRRSLRGLVL
ncbi:AAA family ATPase [Azospirillaceae bacterium]